MNLRLFFSRLEFFSIKELIKDFMPTFWNLDGFYGIHIHGLIFWSGIIAIVFLISGFVIGQSSSRSETEQ